MLKRISISRLGAGRLVLIAVAALAVTAAGAQVCGDEDFAGRQCLPTTDNCADAAATSVLVQVGGEGSVGTATDPECAQSPARDEAGNIVEADITFAFDRGNGSNGTLTLTIVNQTCTPSNSSFLTLWHNLPPEVTGCVLKTAVLNGTNVCKDTTCTTPVQKGWALSGNPNGSGCLGMFDIELDGNGNPNLYGPLPGGTLVMTLDCAGSLSSLTACDFANAGSDADPGERTSKVAAHFQQTDSTNQLSSKVSSNCQDDLFVDLAWFAATPDDGRVNLEWETYLEIDNAGFYILRRNMVTGNVVRINDGLLPAAGDIFEGSYYTLVDETATNGVEYEYVLVDVEIGGVEGLHPGSVAVPNVQRAPIRLESPAYGSSEFRYGTAPTFAWEPTVGRSGVLVISADPSFSDPGSAVQAPIRGRSIRDGNLTLNGRQTREVEALAVANDGILYWQILEPTLGSTVKSSPVYRVGYGLTEQASNRSGPALEQDAPAARLGFGRGGRR